MLLALAVATLAVLFGLLLGLAPTASRRALGPLRTLALTAVIAVVGLHLLPEALAELGAIGLCVFAAGLALPRWTSWLSPPRSTHATGERLGLELGFWGLLVHHLADGLALGAYSRVDTHGDHDHVDVLLALVLHTVPLVAVVAAGYARTSGPRKAILRCGLLALASVLGVFATRLVPEAAVHGAQAWIAAGVSGLLLHGLTHDLDRDLPSDAGGRALDLAMAIAGATLGWIGATLDAHGDFPGAPLGVVLSLSIQRSALPIAVGLLLGALLASLRPSPLQGYARVAEAGEGGVFSPEAFLVSLAHFGLPFAVARDLLGALLLPLRASEPAPPADGTDTAAPPVSRPFLARFGAALDARVDVVVAWGLLGALVAAVIRAAVPEQALAGPTWLAILAALLFSVSVPMHAVAAVQIAFALSDKGLGVGAALLIALLAPLALRPFGLRALLLMLAASVACAALSSTLPTALLAVEPQLGWTAAALLLALLLRRAYQRGFRGFLRPLVHAD